MKKIILSVAALTMIVGATLFTSCTADDTSAPVITLTDDDAAHNVVVYKSAANYTDPGATATDSEDGEITPIVTGTVDMNSAGDYTLTYTATDKAGNTATKTRTVSVDAAAYVQGNYTVSGTFDGDPDDLYTSDNITKSPQSANRIYFNNFCAYQDADIYATLSGASTLTIPSQTIMCGETPNRYNRIFIGSGTFSGTGTSRTLSISGTVALASDPNVTIAWSYSFTLVGK